jgi:sodium/bile acid cotransporter 7
MWHFFVRRWFLLSLALVIAFGMTFPVEMAPLANSLPRQWIVGGVLFLMALPLEVQAMWRVAKSPLAPALAIAMNFLLLPPLAWLVSPLLAEGFSTGLIVASAVPCTLASAAVWTRRSGGNESVALFVTIATNFACFLITPGWLKLLTARAVELPYAEMVSHLGRVVVLPIVLGQALRLWAPVRRAAAQQKLALDGLAQVGILSIVFVGAVDSGLRLAKTPDAQLSLFDWGSMIAAVVAIHVATLLAGFHLARSIGIARPEAQAVGIAGSQKTLMVGLDIAIKYYGGLAILPLVAYHVGQLLVDTVIADRWRSETAQEAESG